MDCKKEKKHTNSFASYGGVQIGETVKMDDQFSIHIVFFIHSSRMFRQQQRQPLTAAITNRQRLTAAAQPKREAH
jgi:hypothetical protein